MSQHHQTSVQQSNSPGGSSTSGREPSGSKADEWSEVKDPSERRKIQNKLAQRRFRDKKREQTEDAEREVENQRRAGSSYASPEPGDIDQREELSEDADQPTSMSAEALSKLSLGDTMVTTRAGAARARTAPTANSPSSSQAPSPTPSFIDSASGLKYDLSVFDDDLRRRAKRGLMDDNAIKMKYCRMTTDDKVKYAFYIDDDITVAMGGSYDVPKCSCGANEGGRACKHIFWMLDQLTSGAPDNIKSQTLRISGDGSNVQELEPAEMIDRMSLDTVADGLDWVLHEGPVPDEEDVEDAIADMLSVFEPSDALPAEFKSPESPYLTERARKYREFKDLFSQLAAENLGLFLRLQAVIDPPFQAHVFFEKINDRINRTFNALDEYITNGPTATLSEAHDVVTCATKLRVLVKAIDEHYHQQVESGRDTKDIAIRAAASLTTILDGVTSRNVDAYAHITWGGIPPSDPTQSNLFVCLIGAPPEEDGLFVVDALKALPQDDIVRNHWETLSNIGEKLAEPWTPAFFLNAFRALTQENRKRSASETGGSDAKRAMHNTAASLMHNGPDRLRARGILQTAWSMLHDPKSA
ncbi:hypothetical protein BDV95DRAFT_602309 [Massariosphaeria phaeospora]|uniref:SWIM-type domain-containing protein n=1 Tax=Massariosphaeria phaeospora TaxID=100035 RepID=A0A7C8IK88_9PLEO|nr:hypothetical protein BDV95DRAFT_602309 [Massariosphaeria phaeospora]